MKKFFVLGALLLTLSWGFAQQTSQELFKKGNAAYNVGNYSLAIEQYEAILSQGKHSAEIYFNLGNAHYRLGNVAESIFYYEKAKRLDSSDEAIENNSDFANNMTLDAIESLPLSPFERGQQSALKLLSLQGWTILTLILAWLGVLFFFLYRWISSITMKRLYFSLGIVLLLLMLVSLAMTYRKDHFTSIPKAVVFDREIEIWVEPNKRAELLFLIHEGTTVEVTDQLEGWSKIKLVNGSEGWVENAGIKSLD
ncbi:MAG: tetratricopeptide repeat protein [Flavobacteriaceae bacterium]